VRSERWPDGAAVLVGGPGGDFAGEVVSDSGIGPVLVRMESNGLVMKIEHRRLRARRQLARSAGPVVPGDTARLHRAEPQPKPAPPARNKRHLDWVRSHPCAFCGRRDAVHAHHHGPRGVGQKTDDWRVVPLCVHCHAELHSCGRLGHMNKDQVDRWMTETAFTLLVLRIEESGL